MAGTIITRTGTIHQGKQPEQQRVKIVHLWHGMGTVRERRAIEQIAAVPVVQSPAPAPAAAEGRGES